MWHKQSRNPACAWPLKMQQDCWHTTDMDPFAWDSLFMLHLPECTTPVTPDCTKGMLPTHLILSLGAAVFVGVATLCLFEAMGKWDVGSPTLGHHQATNQCLQFVCLVTSQAQGCFQAACLAKSLVHVLGLQNPKMWLPPHQLKSKL